MLQKGNAYLQMHTLKKQERLQMNNLASHLMALRKEELIKPKARRREEIFNIKL